MSSTRARRCRWLSSQRAVVVAVAAALDFGAASLAAQVEDPPSATSPMRWSEHIRSGAAFDVVLDLAPEGCSLGTLKGGETYSVEWRGGKFHCTGFNKGANRVGEWVYPNGDPAQNQISLWGRIFTFDKDGNVSDSACGLVGHLTLKSRPAHGPVTTLAPPPTPAPATTAAPASNVRTVASAAPAESEDRASATGPVNWSEYIRSGKPFDVVLDYAPEGFDELGTLKGGETYEVEWRGGKFHCRGFNQGVDRVGQWAYANGDPSQNQISLWGGIFTFDSDGNVFHSKLGLVGRLELKSRPGHGPVATLAPTPAPNARYRIKSISRQLNSPLPYEREEYVYSGDRLVRVNWRRLRPCACQGHGRNTTRVINYSQDGSQITIDYPFQNAPSFMVLKLVGGQVVSAARTDLTSRIEYTYAYSGSRLVRYKMSTLGPPSERYKISYSPDGRIASSHVWRIGQESVSSYAWTGDRLDRVEIAKVTPAGNEPGSYLELQHDSAGRLTHTRQYYYESGKTRASDDQYDLAYDANGCLASFKTRSDYGVETVKYEYEPGVGNAALLDALPHDRLSVPPEGPQCP